MILFRGELETTNWPDGREPSDLHPTRASAPPNREAHTHDKSKFALTTLTFSQRRQHQQVDKDGAPLGAHQCDFARRAPERAHVRLDPMESGHLIEEAQVGTGAACEPGRETCLRETTKVGRLLLVFG